MLPGHFAKRMSVTDTCTRIRWSPRPPYSHFFIPFFTISYPCSGKRHNSSTQVKSSLANEFLGAQRKRGEIQIEKIHKFHRIRLSCVHYFLRAPHLEIAVRPNRWYYRYFENSGSSELFEAPQTFVKNSGIVGSSGGWVKIFIEIGERERGEGSRATVRAIHL